MGVRQAIREANALLPGEPVEKGTDPRWQAIMVVGDYIETEPEAVWGFIRHWGGHPLVDLRNAVATCLLEEMLRRHFAPYFARVEELAMAEPPFGDMFLRCWRLGQADEPGNAEQFESLVQRLRQKK